MDRNGQTEPSSYASEIRRQKTFFNYIGTHKHSFYIITVSMHLRIIHTVVARNSMFCTNDKLQFWIIFERLIFYRNIHMHYCCVL